MNREENLTPKGYQCFHCGHYAVYWCGDFDFEEYGYDGKGIVQECHCYNCGADITYRVPILEGQNDEQDM